MATVWSATQINRYALQAEELFCQEYKLLTDRYAIPIVSGAALYTLPEGCFDIRRITYKGDKLDPISHRNSRFFFEGSTSTGKPTSYIYNNLGQLTIKLFPFPNETLPALQDNLYEPSRIAAQCIAEFYVMPDGISIQLPSYMRRRFLKSYILYQCFLAEGKGQNLKAAAYWQKKWETIQNLYGDQLNELITSARKILSPPIGTEYSGSFNSMMNLPANLRNTGVDPGD